MSNAKVTVVKNKLSCKRPLTAYNIFFRFKRSRILSSGKGDKDSIRKLIAVAPGLEDGSSDEFAIRRAIIRKEMQGNLLPFEGKRRHRKRHGMMDFIEMSRAMCEQWQNVDERTKGIFQELAEEGKQLHHERLVAYTANNAHKEVETSAISLDTSSSVPANDRTSKSTDETKPAHLDTDMQCSPAPSKNGEINIVSPIDIVIPVPACYGMGTGKLIVSSIGPPPFYKLHMHPMPRKNLGCVEEIYEDEFCSFIDQNINVLDDDDIALELTDDIPKNLTDLVNMDETIDHCMLPPL